MSRMPIGTIALVITAVLIYFGLAQRVLDRMRLTDRAALAFIGLIIVGSYIDIRLVREPAVSINVGGAVIPAILSGYLYSKAGTAKEKTRSLVAPLVTGIAIYALGRALPAEPEAMVIDPLYLYGIAAGLIAYLMGRSRRAAFIAGLMGVVISDLLHLGEILVRGIPGTADIGGAGVFDATIIAGLLAVLLAELVGESRERLQGGPVPVDERSPELRGQVFTPAAQEQRPAEKETKETFVAQPDEEDLE